MRESHINFKDLWSGSEPYQELTEDVVAKACGSRSDAWVSSIQAYSFRFGLYFNETECYERFSGTSRFCSGLTPAGESKTLRGSQVALSGVWRNVSGIREADFSVVRGLDQYGGHWFFLLHKGDWSTRDDWNMVALQETFSDTLVVSEAILSESRRLPAERIVSGNPVEGFERATSTPLQSVGTLTVLAPLVGISKEIGEYIRLDKNPRAMSFLKSLEKARSRCFEVARELDRWSVGSDPVWLHKQLSDAGKDLHKTASEYLCSGGTSFWSKDSQMGNFLRDIVVGSTHPAISRC